MAINLYRHHDCRLSDNEIPRVSTRGYLFTSGTPSGNTPLSSVAFAFPEKCSAERTLAEESSEYDLTGATLAVLSRGSAKVKKHRKSGAFSFGTPSGNRTHNCPLGGGRYIHLTMEACAFF